MWLFLALLSALLLGIYDVSKKVSVQGNAVIPVLLTSVLFSSALLLPFLLISRLQPEWLSGTPFFVPVVDFETHLYLILKAVIVLSSWLFAYFAMKHLPITLASPIKATQPVWVVLGGVLIFGEKLNGYQTAGVVVTLISFFMFSFAGKKEGFSLRSSKWIWFIILATLTGAVSGLYDKYLLHRFDHMAVQTYYTFYQALIMALITLFLWAPTRKKTTPFQFRWSIALISVFLVSADFAYFYALTMPDSLISVVSTMRRAGVVVPFLYGAFVMHDKHLKLKVIDMIGVILGMVLLFLGS
ncbi:MAG: EamA family transporter [Bacteroidia bacterium]|jgi:transporter family protein|nr:DMT family transporter [Paludibacter sp.]NCB68916.1 EamA family transporter [Bacteroidia bacterium]